MRGKRKPCSNKGPILAFLIKQRRLKPTHHIKKTETVYVLLMKRFFFFFQTTFSLLAVKRSD